MQLLMVYLANWPRRYEMKYDKINHKLITDNESERSELLNYEINQERGDSGRWEEEIRSIIQLDPSDSIDGIDKPRLFKMNWQRGLTEMQENEFYDDDIPEVFIHQSISLNLNSISYLDYNQMQKQNSSFDSIIDSLKVIGKPEGIKQIKEITDDEINQLETTLSKFELIDDLSKNMDDEHQVVLDYLNKIRAIKDKINKEL